MDFPFLWARAVVHSSAECWQVSFFEPCIYIYEVTILCWLAFSGLLLILSLFRSHQHSVHHPRTVGTDTDLQSVSVMSCYYYHGWTAGSGWMVLLVFTLESMWHHTSTPWNVMLASSCDNIALCSHSRNKASKNTMTVWPRCSFVPPTWGCMMSLCSFCRSTRDASEHTSGMTALCTCSYCIMHSGFYNICRWLVATAAHYHLTCEVECRQCGFKPYKAHLSDASEDRPQKLPLCQQDWLLLY